MISEQEKQEFLAAFSKALEDECMRVLGPTITKILAQDHALRQRLLALYPEQDLATITRTIVVILGLLGTTKPIETSAHFKSSEDGRP